MCCLFGMIDTKNCFTGKQKSKLLSILASECEVRGTDATGIAYNSGGKLKVYKRPVAAHKLRFYVPDDARVIMGHTRMTTQGSAKRNQNNHPWRGHAGESVFALAHNGVIYNDRVLRRTFKLPNTNIETDSYIAVQLLEEKRALTFDSLTFMAEQVEGSFAFTVLDERNHLYFIKGDNPICLYHYPQYGLYFYASTQEILTRTIAQMPWKLDVPVPVVLECGNILRVDDDGAQVRSSFDATQLDWDWGAHRILLYTRNLPFMTIENLCTVMKKNTYSTLS